MSAALYFAEDHATLRPPFRASTRPTLAPTSHHWSDAPSTQRSATAHPRFAAAAQSAGPLRDAHSLLASIRLNADFLSAMLYGNASPSALEALEDLRRCIDWLEPHLAADHHDVRVTSQSHD